jgi:hypothetical protein
LTTIAERFLLLGPGARADLLDALGPDELWLLESILPVSGDALAQARADTADPLLWSSRYLPEIAGLEHGPHHKTIAGLLPADGPDGVRAAVGAPRGSGKSTTALSLVPVVAAVRLSHRFIIVLRDNLPDAISSVAGIRRLLDGHPELIARYPWLRPLVGKAGTLELAGGVIIMARSTGSAIRGLNRTLQDGQIIRPDLVVCDDLEDEESARSSLQVGRLEEWMLAVIGQLGGPPGASATGGALDLIVIGTTLERDALVSRMLDGIGPFQSWERHRFPASGTVALMADDRLAVVDAENVPTSIPVPDGSTVGERVPLWPSGMPLEHLDRLTEPTDPLFVGSVIYAREYQLRPSHRGDTLFNPASTVWMKGLADLWLSGSLPVEHSATAVDPAISVRDSADYTAVIVTGLYRPSGSRPDGTPWPRRIAVPYAERRRCTPTELIAWVEQVAKQWTRDGKVTFEAEGAFAWAADELKRQRSVSVRAVTSQGADKRTRAVPLSVWHEAGRVELDQSLKGGAFDREFHGFTGTGSEDHDDLVDAMVYGAAFVTNSWRRRD